MISETLRKRKLLVKLRLVKFHFSMLRKNFTTPFLAKSATIWLHLARASVASYILYFAAMGVACSVGLFGCWGMSSTKLIATSISLLFAFVFGVSGMGLFHAAHFYETNKVIQVQFLLIEPTNILKYRKNIFFNLLHIFRILKKKKKNCRFFDF